MIRYCSVTEILTAVSYKAFPGPLRDVLLVGDVCDDDVGDVLLEG